MKVVIADDEAPARSRLSKLLERAADVVLVGCAANGREALLLIERERPDLVFLDIEMPGVDGLAVASSIEQTLVVFTTAHARFAVAAFDVGACDFLLKPLDRARLQQALSRAHERLAARASASLSTSPSTWQVLVQHRGVCQIFDARTITRFWSDDKYTFFLIAGEEHILRQSLDALESQLEPLGFLRVHRSELVRTAAIVQVVNEGSAGRLTLTDGQSAQVSRRALPALRRVLVGV